MANSLFTSLTLLFLPLLPTSLAYSWSFVHPPQQCANLSIAVNGSDGKPPYRLLIIPFGATPLPNAIEARKIMDVAFPGTENKVEFPLRYPENSQFVAVVTDSSGFGSGGTSLAAQVMSSNDASCFDATTNVSPQFYFSIDPPNQIVQCQDTRIYWNPDVVSGTPSFQGVIPGGQSFSIPVSSNITAIANLGTGFTWKPSLRSGTTLILVASDNRGSGTGGSILNVVSAGTNQDSSCLSNTSPSSTPGSPAGGSYPTGGGGWVGNSGSSSTSSSSSSNIGTILGIVLGVFAFLVASVCLVWFYHRRQRRANRAKEGPVDLMYADDDDDEREDGRRSQVLGGLGGRSPSRLNELPEFYQPEPFMVPDPTRLSTDGRTNRSTITGMDELEGQRPLSGGSTSMYTRVTTPDLYGGSVAGETVLSGSGTGPPSGRRKGGPLRPMRPVNIIQHDDAGPSIAPEEGAEPETIELPPAYSALRGAAVVTPTGR